MPEWLMGADCKSAGYAYVGSNPTRPKYIKFKFINSYSFFYSLFVICYFLFPFACLLKAPFKQQGRKAPFKQATLAF